MTPADVTPPPSAYPDPIHLPVAPRGNPLAARLLAGSYLGLADRLDHAASHVAGISGDLGGRWHGHGATALRVPTETMAANLYTLARSYRDAADHLNDYADALHHAQHHHGWSLGKIVAIGAIVTVTAVAVVVTVGAAAPVGTLAAAEVGEAILGAEAAAAGATAAETTAAEGLSLAGQSMGALRGLVAVALPHLTQGAVSTGLDTGLHLATGHGMTGRDLTGSFLAGAVGSATTATTRSALRASESYAGAGLAGKAALDTAALTATLTADTALEEYATTGRLNPTTLTEDAVLSAVTGGAASLRHPLNGTGAVTRAPALRGQSLADVLRQGIKLESHEGGWPYGHTIAKHVGLSEEQLTTRLTTEVDRDTVSTFTDIRTAERAITDIVGREPAKIAALLGNPHGNVVLKARLGYDVGVVMRRGRPPRVGSAVTVVLTVIGNRLVVVTAFVG